MHFPWRAAVYCYSWRILRPIYHLGPSSNRTRDIHLYFSWNGFVFCVWTVACVLRGCRVPWGENENFSRSKAKINRCCFKKKRLDVPIKLILSVPLRVFNTLNNCLIYLLVCCVNVLLLSTYTFVFRCVMMMLGWCVVEKWTHFISSSQFVS